MYMLYQSLVPEAETQPKRNINKKQKKRKTKTEGVHRELCTQGVYTPTHTQIHAYRIFPVYQSITQPFIGGDLGHFNEPLPHQYLSFSFPMTQHYLASSNKSCTMRSGEYLAHFPLVACSIDKAKVVVPVQKTSQY